MWVLVVALWLPWIDYGKTYRPVAESLARALPKNPGCIERRGLGAPQRAMLDYHAGIRTEPWADGQAAPRCRFVIAQGHPREEIAPGPGWRKLADVGRPGDKGERYRLYRYGPG